MKHIPANLYLKLFFRDPGFAWTTVGAIVINLAVWGLIGYQKDVLYQPEQPFIPLHYKVLYGIDYIGPWYYVFALPVIGIAIILVNYAFARMAYHYEKIVMYFLIISAACVQVILLWALHLIVQINIF